MKRTHEGAHASNPPRAASGALFTTIHSLACVALAIAAAALLAVLPMRARAQAAPEPGYGYCTALYDQWSNSCWLALWFPDPNTYTFATPQGVCDAELANARHQYPQYIWTMTYIPGPTRLGGYPAPWGSCRRRSNSVSGFGAADILVARVKWSPPAPVDPPVIALSGPSRTKAMPAGPILPQWATVTKAGAAVAGKTVNITITGAGTISGTTNASGQFEFSYVPPERRATTAMVTATCTDCTAPATKQIVVEHCDICGN
jgi:hypothetical protein